MSLDNVKKFSSEPSLNEPFISGRASGRLVFDLGVLFSLLLDNMRTHPILDVGAGSGWVSEYCVRLGLKTFAFDIHDGLRQCVEGRLDLDKRLDPSLFNFAKGDAHDMPFEDGFFGHILCYDSLHHMRNYSKVFSEFFRVLRKGGRAIFVEPGARHSTAPETVAFVKSQKLSDPDWIEKDVILEEVDSIALSAGFLKGVCVVPVPHPLSLQTYSMAQWNEFRRGSTFERARYTDQLASLNYWDRVIFYVERI